jgi:cell division protein FtsQ
VRFLRRSGSSERARRPSWERRTPARPGLAGAPARFAARARRRRVGRVLPWLIATATLATAVAVVWLVGWSSLLTLQHVEIRGVDDDVADDVAAALAAPVGTPLAQLDLVALDRAAEQVPEVRAVEVTRVWPRTVRVDVAPRTPAAAVRIDRRWRYVDEAGVVFGAAPKRPADLVVVDASAGGGSRAQTSAAMAVLGSLPDALVDRLGVVRVASAADVQLVLDDGTTVVWGTADRSPRKAEVLLALLEHPARGYDVSAPDRPALRGARG